MNGQERKKRNQAVGKYEEDNGTCLIKNRNWILYTQRHDHTMDQKTKKLKSIVDYFITYLGKKANMKTTNELWENI